MTNKGRNRLRAVCRLLLVLAVLLTVFNPGFSLAANPEVQVTNSLPAQMFAKIYGTKIVYCEFTFTSKWDVKMYDLATGTTTVIATGPAWQLNASIYGNKIVWQDDRNGNYDIYMYDLSTGVETRLSWSTAAEEYPQIYDQKVVWERAGLGNYRDVYLYHVDSQVTQQITSGAGNEQFPDVYGDNIVWTDTRHGGHDLYSYKISNGVETRLTAPGAAPNEVWPAPSIFENNIAYGDSRDGDHDVYLYDLDTGSETQITGEQDVLQYRADIWGDKIVWEQASSTCCNLYDLYVYDIPTQTEQRLTGFVSQHFLPAIYGDRVVWHDSRNKLYQNENYDIYTMQIPPGPYNHTPTAPPQSLSLDEDTQAGVTLQAADGDGDALTFSITNGPSHGALTGTAPNLVYTPEANYNGPDSFTYKASDGMAGSAVATVSINVLPVSDPPDAQDDSADVAEDSSSQLDVLVNDMDPDGDILGLLSVSQPVHGSAVIDGGQVVYTPDPDYNGGDTFSCTISDGNGGEDTANVSVEVAPLNDAPAFSAVDPWVAVNEAASASYVLSASDIDGDQLHISSSGEPSFASITDNGDGSATIALTPGYEDAGNYTISVEVCDAHLCDDTLVTVQVSNTNRAPAVASLAIAIDEDETASFSLSGSDPDGDPLSYQIISQPLSGVLIGTAPTLIYVPLGNFNGGDAFSYQVVDPGGASASGSAVITINAVNDPSSAADDAATVDEDSSAVINVLTNDSDPDGDPLTIVSATQGASGSTTVNPDGTITFAPSVNFNGTVSFSYTITDPSGLSSTANVDVTVNAVNDAPGVDAGADAVVDEGSTATLSGSGVDIDGDQLSYSWIQISGTPASLISSGETTSFVAPEVDDDSVLVFQITVNDGQTSVTDTVNVTVKNVVSSSEKPQGSGYWKTHPESLASVLERGPISLGDTLVTSTSQAISILGGNNAKDARYALRAQLLATFLALRSHADPAYGGTDIRPTAYAARDFLATHSEPVGGSSPDRATVLALKDTLEAYNLSGF